MSFSGVAYGTQQDSLDSVYSIAQELELDPINLWQSEEEEKRFICTQRHDFNARVISIQALIFRHLNQKPNFFPWHYKQSLCHHAWSHHQYPSQKRVNCHFAHSLLTWIAFNTYAQRYFKTKICIQRDSCPYWAENKCKSLHPGDLQHIGVNDSPHTYWTIYNPNPLKQAADLRRDSSEESQTSHSPSLSQEKALQDSSSAKPRPIGPVHPHPPSETYLLFSPLTSTRLWIPETP